MSKKLVIRINNLQDLETSDDYEVEEETAIRWDRVIPAAISAVLLLVALVWGTWYFLSSEDSSNEMQAFDVTSEPVAKDSEASFVVASEVEAEREVEVMQNPEPSLGVENIAEKPLTANEELVEDVAPEAETNVAIVDVVKPPVASAADTIAEVPAISMDEEAPIAAAVFADPVVIESNRIVEAQLTHGVKKSGPVDRLGNVVSMNTDKLIKVYLFTGMEGLKGETLYHDWYLSGKKMARVKIKVRSDKTSASSSKFIDQYMVGDWRVQVTTSRGERLVTASFNVTP